MVPWPTYTSPAWRLERTRYSPVPTADPRAWEIGAHGLHVQFIQSAEAGSAPGSPLTGALAPLGAAGSGPPRWRRPASASRAVSPLEILYRAGIRPKLAVGDHPESMR
jgi:hypothetical protein